MNLIPAIDLIGGQAVRLKKGDYNQVTVYNTNPSEVAASFEKQGASFLHIVDLDGAKNGSTANFSTIQSIVSQTNLSVEVGGGIRSIETVEKYLSLGVDRVILGTAAVTDPDFLKQCVRKYPQQTAVGIDIKDGLVAIKGWTEVSNLSCFDFCRFVEDLGVQTIICTDISKDGMMSGTNVTLYRSMGEQFHMNIIASGGVSTMQDIEQLCAIKIFGAILGKALYTGSIDLAEAISKTKEFA